LHSIVAIFTSRVAMECIVIIVIVGCKYKQQDMACSFTAFVAVVGQQEASCCTWHDDDGKLKRSHSA
jgi:hypothetical protein